MKEDLAVKKHADEIERRLLLKLDETRVKVEQCQEMIKNRTDDGSSIGASTKFRPSVIAAPIPQIGAPMSQASEPVEVSSPSRPESK